MAKKKFYQGGLKSSPNSRGVRRSTRIAMGIFIVAAAACEILLITGFRKDPHPLMYGIVIGVMTMVFIGIGFSIHYIGKLAQKEQQALEEKQKDAEGKIVEDVFNVAEKSASNSASNASENDSEEIFE